MGERWPADAAGGRPGDGFATVLLVEDHRDVREILARVLAMDGYAVQAAASGREALALLEAGGCAALVCDIGLPDVSGLEVIAAARRRRPAMAVIALTGLATEELTADLLELGCDAILLKPLPRLKVLSETVGEALARRRPGENEGR